MLLKIIQNKVFISFMKYSIVFLIGFLTATVLLGLRFYGSI
ncbi:hypothetical protein [Aliarcobacter butzleri]|nr:hypothetical protein [Aliarcobacter butzleri]